MSTQPRITEVPQENPIAVTALGLKKRVEDLDRQIKAFSELASVTEYQAVSEIGLAAARVVKEATAFYQEEIGQLHKMWRDKCSERSAIIDPAENVKNLAGRLAGGWQQAQERLRLAEERRQQEIERQKAETEAIETAAQLEMEGRTEEAEAIMSSPVEVMPVSVPTAVPRVNGVTAPRKRCIPEVTSLLLLVKAVAEGKVPLKAVEANMVFLRQQATSMGTELRYPGVKVKEEAKSAFRS